MIDTLSHLPGLAPQPMPGSAFTAMIDAILSEAPKPDDITPDQAIEELKAGKFQRCCSPGQWRVFWRDGKAVFEDLSEINAD